MDQQLLGRESRPEHAQMLELASTRYVTYRVLASAFLPPTPDRVDGIVTMPGDIIDDPIAARFPYFPAWREFLLKFGDLAAQPLSDIHRCYNAAFTSDNGDSAEMLHESQYLTGSEQERAEIIRDLVKRFNNAGLTVGAESNLPPDHISVQLEYLAVLCDLEATGWNDEEPRQAVRALRLGRAYLRKHLCWWLPRLEHQLASTAPDSVYLSAARAVTEFTHHELDLLDMIIQIYEQSPSPEGDSRDA